MGVSPVIEVEKRRKAVNYVSPAFAISRRRAARKRSSADKLGIVPMDLGTEELIAAPAGEHALKW
jgi:hypothetical protein